MAVMGRGQSQVPSLVYLIKKPMVWIENNLTEIVTIKATLYRNS